MKDGKKCRTVDCMVLQRTGMAGDVCMKIQEVCKRTGISKRNIHFYIKEKLLLPEMNEENGYYNFSDEDCQRLLIVRELRRAGMAISSIRSILNAPTVTGYYLRLHANQLKKEIKYQQQVVESMEYILRMLPVNPTLKNVLRSAKRQKFRNLLRQSVLKLMKPAIIVW